MRVLIACLLIWLAPAARADSPDPAFPALYAVTGVAADDRLNIRAAPDGAADIIGTLAPTAKDIEVITLSREGRWALLNSGESSGWVAVRFLLRQEQARTITGLRCFGTEPFWDIRFDSENQLTLTTPDTNSTHAITALSPDPAFINLGQYGLRLAWLWEEMVTAHILPGRCSDGMSDRTYGLHYIDNIGPRVGCCSLN